MTKEELIQFLKENLNVEISLKAGYEGDGYIEAIATVMLGGEQISYSTSYDYIRIDRK